MHIPVGIISSLVARVTTNLPITSQPQLHICVDPRKDSPASLRRNDTKGE